MNDEKLKQAIREAIRTMPLVDFCRVIGLKLSPAQNLLLKSFEKRAHLRGHLCEQEQQSKVRQLISLN
jgi:hypothetical protein